MKLCQVFLNDMNLWHPLSKFQTYSRIFPIKCISYTAWIKDFKATKCDLSVLNRVNSSHNVPGYHSCLESSRFEVRTHVTVILSGNWTSWLYDSTSCFFLGGSDTISPSKESGLCGSLCTYNCCQFCFFFIILQCSSEHSSLWENTVCIKILCFFRPSKLLGHSCVGVMDLQDHCAVVTLVVSNCLKKLMSHSCPYRPL